MSECQECCGAIATTRMRVPTRNHPGRQVWVCSECAYDIEHEDERRAEHDAEYRDIDRLIDMRRGY